MIDRQSRFVLWIDSVAAVLVCPQDEVWVGQAVPAAGVQLPFQANLRRRHLRLWREDGRYWMEEPGAIAGDSLPSAFGDSDNPRRRMPDRRTDRQLARGPEDPPAETQSPRLVSSGQELSLGQGLGLRLRIPNPLTSTAILEYLGPLRSVPRTDFAILMAQACVMGNRYQHHILIPELDQATLFFQGSRLTIKTTEPMVINAQVVGHTAVLSDGDRIECPAFAMTVEVLTDTC